MSALDKQVMHYQVKVKPGSKKGPLVEEIASGQLIVYFQEPAVDGKANAALTKVLAKHFDVKKRDVRIIQGLKSRNKVVEVRKP